MQVNVTRSPRSTRNTLLRSVDAQSERIMVRLFEDADIRVDGARPQDMQVHDKRLYTRILTNGLLGFGESYMDGQWDCDALDDLTVKLLRAEIDKKVRANWSNVFHVFRAKTLNLQTTERAFEIAEHHYDLGNDIYQAMLDPRMIYSCAYWREANNLEEAQTAKLDLVCRKVGLRAGMKVLDIGCGWGGFAKYAAERYGVEVTGYTVSRNQVQLGREACKGLPVDIRLDDYRKATGSYDAVVSIGMFEHVGYKNHRAFMEVVHRCLKDDGIALVHTIGGNRSTRAVNPWFGKYIFPNALIPSLAQVARATEELFSVEDIQNFGPDYDRTLLAWYENFERAWPTLEASYGERFRRMWRFYLLTATGAARARYQQLYQIVLTKIGQPQPDCMLRGLAD